MLPPLPSKQLLCIRAISTMVFDKIATETVDSNLLTISQIQFVAMPNPDDTLFIIWLVYSTYIYYKITIDETKVTEPTPFLINSSLSSKRHRRIVSKRTKLNQFNKFVLTDSGYHIIKMCLLIMCILIKDPKAVV